MQGFFAIFRAWGMILGSEWLNFVIMLFKRKNRPDLWQSMRQLLWPTMGWVRVLHYYRLRVIRMSNPTHSIAANMAGSAAMSFTPFFGLHIFGGMGIGWILGGGFNFLAATVGSLLGNPWTTPFMMYSSYRIGDWVLRVSGLRETVHHVEISPEFMEQHGENIIQRIITGYHETGNLIDYIINSTWDIFVPTAVGGLITVIVTTPIFYYIFYYLIETAQKARRNRIKNKYAAKNSAKEQNKT